MRSFVFPVRIEIVIFDRPTEPIFRLVGKKYHQDPRDPRYDAIMYFDGRRLKSSVISMLYFLKTGGESVLYGTVLLVQLRSPVWINGDFSGITVRPCSTDFAENRLKARRVYG